MATIFDELPRRDDVLNIATEDLAMRMLRDLKGNLNRHNYLIGVNSRFGNDEAVEKAFLAAWAYLVRHGYFVERGEPGWFFVSPRGEEEKNKIKIAGLPAPTLRKVVGGRWAVQKELSPGGQGVTSLVKDQTGSSDELFVLKELRRAGDQQARSRFETEVKALDALRHPNILRVFDYNVTDTQPWFVTEYCAGRGLDTVAMEQLDLHTKINIFLDVCRALAAAHSTGITHRDIKPENILLKSSQGPTVLGDFGICWFVESTDDRLTKAHEDIGSSFCRAPELFDGPLNAVAPSSDIYCLGKLLYWLMVGKGGRAGRLRTEEFERSEKNLVTIHGDAKFEHVNELLRKMVAEEPSHRFADAGEVYHAAMEAFDLMENDYQPINRPPERCQYCGRGAYAERARTHGTETELSILQGWRIFECKRCGHTLLFRKNQENARW